MAELFGTDIELEVVTPEARLFSGRVDRVSVPGVDGMIGILPGHAPLLSELGIGSIEFISGGAPTRIYCSYGFLEVLGERVSVLAEVAATSDEIDVSAAEADRREAEATLRSTDPGTDYDSAAERLRQAQAQLEVAQG